MGDYLCVFMCIYDNGIYNKIDYLCLFLINV